MRHNVYGKKLGRDKNQRTALFKSLINSLILSEKIETTESKAKAVKGLVDRIITQAKTPSTQRLVSQFLTQKKITDKLIKEILPRLETRTSGYTSVVKLGRRQGDGTMMVRMSLLLEESAKPSKKAETAESVKVEAPVLEKPVKAPKRAKKEEKQK